MLAVQASRGLVVGVRVACEVKQLCYLSEVLLPNEQVDIAIRA